MRAYARTGAALPGSVAHSWLTEKMDVVRIRSVSCGTERRQLELAREPLVHIFGRVVCAAETRARRSLVEHDELAAPERLLFGLGQPPACKVVLAHRGHEQEST